MWNRQCVRKLNFDLANNSSLKREFYQAYLQNQLCISKWWFFAIIRLCTIRASKFGGMIFCEARAWEITSGCHLYHNCFSISVRKLAVRSEIQLIFTLEFWVNAAYYVSGSILFSEYCGNTAESQGAAQVSFLFLGPSAGTNINMHWTETADSFRQFFASYLK